VPHQFYQLNSWLRILKANASGRGVSGNLKKVPELFLIHCYNRGVGPTITAIEAYARDSSAASAFYSSLKDQPTTRA
jgi:hypothetical protein